MGEFTPEFTGWPRNAQAVDVQPGRCPEVPFSRKLAKAASVGSRATRILGARLSLTCDARPARVRQANPDFFPNVPSPATLGGFQSTQVIQEVGARLRTPYILQSAVTIERQLPANTTMAVTYTNSHGLHLLRSEDINTPRLLRDGQQSPVGIADQVHVLEPPAPVFPPKLRESPQPASAKTRKTAAARSARAGAILLLRPPHSPHV